MNQSKNDEKALSYFDSVDQIKEVSESGEKVVICHFPLAEWDGFKMAAGSYMAIFMQIQMIHIIL